MTYEPITLQPYTENAKPQAMGCYLTDYNVRDNLNFLVLRH